jgi:hypothetical protein
MTGGSDHDAVHPPEQDAGKVERATTMKQPKLSTYNGFVPAEAQMNLAAN